MSEVPLVKLDEILTVLTEAARSRGSVRVFLREPDGSGRPMRIVEGVVLDVSDGRDGRTRVRFAIPTGAGEPVEVRVLVEGIERAEVVPTAANGDGASRSNSGPYRRPTDSLVVPRGSVDPEGGFSVPPRSPDRSRHRRRG